MTDHDSKPDPRIVVQRFCREIIDQLDSACDEIAYLSEDAIVVLHAGAIEGHHERIAVYRQCLSTRIAFHDAYEELLHFREDVQEHENVRDMYSELVTLAATLVGPSLADVARADVPEAVATAAYAVAEHNMILSVCTASCVLPGLFYRDALRIFMQKPSPIDNTRSLIAELMAEGALEAIGKMLPFVGFFHVCVEHMKTNIDRRLERMAGWLEIDRVFALKEDLTVGQSFVRDCKNSAIAHRQPLAAIRDRLTDAMAVLRSYRQSQSVS
jgi:hypothetical protein